MMSALLRGDWRMRCQLAGVTLMTVALVWMALLLIVEVK